MAHSFAQLPLVLGKPKVALAVSADEELCIKQT